MVWREWIDSQLDEVRSAGRWRQTRTFDGFGPAGRMGAAAVVSFASNDYLGLSAHPAVVAAAGAAAARWGTGATASRLIVGTRPVHEELEAEIADWTGTDAALVFSSGYTANVGVMATFGGPDVTVFSDELNHASIIDGCRLSRSSIRVYRHCDASHLDGLLIDAATSAPGGRRLVVTDSVFSMDGDVAPLVELTRVCARHDALLVVDDAHAVLDGHRAVPAAGEGPDVVRVGTLSKALGALGGWVAGSTPAVDLLVNRARSFIFTTGLSPADAAAALAALRVVRSPEGDGLVGRLRAAIDRVRPGHPSPIIPIVLGGEDRAVDAAAALLERGLLVPAIRPPTVPAGTSRLRVAMSAAHTDEDIDRLQEALAGLGVTP
ncbi:8-amino-7-oxononanoate synthase [Acidiferrimicrobium sp. IK]|uniref:aminotransferase class I/II-fold pyridoxal phosphate-dependent enzyme n=1 Tax=Acidiferrimicrobium sp. IK TaxID=2871700 RepID=UPI0021CAF841|nr:8-amino-7-oxononanoate synthase [Acidiferrimicrobium sp. IK]MCU4185948.1 8-amino-7-oxononanoate synthase [Acidiferrimicrobium sp. IK]